MLLTSSTKKPFYAIIAAIFAVLTLSQPISAISINNNLIENGVTQFDYDASSSGSCTELTQTSEGGIIGGINLGAEPKERRVNLIKAFMSTYGLTPAQAAGIVGNFAVEAGNYASDTSPAVRPDINQGKTGSDTGQTPDPGGLGYGWAQWSGGRKTAFVRFLNENPQWVSEGRATDTANFNYLKKELEESYKGTIPALKETSNPTAAMKSFEETFERAGKPNYSERQKWANNAYQEYKAAGGSDSDVISDGPGSPGCAGVGTSQSAYFGEVVFPLKGGKKVVKNPGMFNNGDTDRGGHPYIAYDILVDPSVEVLAFASGVVTYTSADRCGGKFLTIWNEEAKLGVTYMHLGNHIPKGTEVAVGGHVGTIGSAAAGCGTPHLHIDVATDKIRQGCSRLSCSIMNHFRSIGKDLYQAYEALPE